MGYRAAASTSGALQTRKSSGGQPAAAAAAARPTSRPYPRSSTESGTVATATAAAAAATSPSTKSHTAVAAASQPALSSRLATRESYVDVEDALLAATRSLGGSSDFSDGGTGTGGESSSPAKSASPDRHRRRTRQGLTKRVSIALSASSGSGDSETGSDSGSQAESDVNSDLGLNFSSAVRAQRSQSELMTRPPSLAYPDAGQLKPTRSIIRRSTVTESDERISPGSPGSATAASPSRPQSSRVKFDHLSSPTGPRSRLPSTGGALVPTISKVNAAAQGQRQPSFLGVSLSGMEELGAHAESSGGAPYVRIATGVPSGTMDVVSAFSGLASPDFATAVPFQRTRSGLSSMGGYTEHRKSLDARNGPSGLRVSQGAVTSQQSRMRSQPGSQDNVTQAPVPRCVDDIDQSGKVRRTVAMPVVAPAEDEVRCMTLSRALTHESKA